MQDKLLTLKETAECLRLTEEQVRRLVNEGKIPAYQIGGMYLRFKEETVFSLRAKLGGRILHERIKRHDRPAGLKDSFVSGIRDFLYFNDFYIIAAALIIFLIYIILKVIH
jgi:excisionase family DNA binding protein